MNEPLKVLSLFAGIGGFDLGLERTGGFKTVAFCEIEPFCRRVLAKHWPEVPCYDDVRTLTGERLAADGIAVDVIVGGFPCQDISYAGKGAGLEGERSGLFFEVARMVGELGPKLVVLENVSALLGRGLAEVLGTLAALGYDVEWDCIPAAHVGAPHRRDRAWLLAYRQGDPLGSDADRIGPYRAALNLLGSPELLYEQVGELGPLGEDVAHAEIMFRNGGSNHRQGRSPGAHALSQSRDGRRDTRTLGGWWSLEPGMGRVADGLPGRVDRLKSLGNAVVPQIPELIGRAILQARAAA